MSRTPAHPPVREPSLVRSSARQAAAALCRVADLGINVPCTSEVAGYLVKHLDTLSALERVAAVAAARLADHAQLSLELYRDPETADKYLSIYVCQTEYQDELLEQIESVWDEYDPYLRDVSGWILTTTDFRPPLD